MKTARQKQKAGTETSDDAKSVKIEGLTDKQAAFLPALLASPTVKEACFKAGVSEASAWRWLNGDAKFREQYRLARRQVVEHVIVRIQTDAAQAAKVLRDVADDKEASPSARVSAAKTIIELAVKAVEIGDVEARLEALEQHIIKREAQDAFRQEKSDKEDDADEDDAEDEDVEDDEE
ncbi:MAG TPA: hypothetical protein VGB73_18845 [Pyrinomonadaceae bacterium]|jgi:hypothetical protein